MKRFNDTWNGTDNLDLYVEVALLPGYPEKYPHLEVIKDLVNKMEEPGDISTMEISGTRKPTTRSERRTATRKAKKHLREIEPLTMSVRQTRNGAYIHKGDTYSWLPEWKKADHRSERRAGKKLCQRYDIPEREIIPTVEDIDPEGTWDVESQCFLYDRKKRTIKRRLRDVEEMEFPAIINVEVDYNISWGVDTEFYSLGLIESVEEGKAAVEKFIARFSDKGNSFPDITISSAPIKGTLFIGGAFYEEAEEVD